MSALPTPQPALLPFNPDGVPQFLKDQPQWCCAKVTWNAGKGRYDKVPVDAKTGRAASSTDPRTWADFATALAYYRRNPTRVQAMMFALTPPLVGMDWDHVVDSEAGEIDPDVRADLVALGTYADRSISGTGVHAIGIAEKPGADCRIGNFEIYGTARLLVITGHTVGELRDVVDCQEPVNRLYARKFPPRPELVCSVTTVGPLYLSDTHLIRKCGSNEKFRRLMARDDSDYNGDASRADLAFACCIVNNGGTREQVETLLRRFREREKFDRRDGDSTWLEKRVLDVALDGTVEVWQPAKSPVITTVAADSGSDQVGDTPPEGATIADLWRELLASRAEVTELRRIGEIRDRRYAAEREKQKLDAKIARNTGLGAERYAGIAIANLLEERLPRDQDARIATATIPRLTIAKRTGFKENTAGSHAKRLEELGFDPPRTCRGRGCGSGDRGNPRLPQGHRDRARRGYRERRGSSRQTGQSGVTETGKPGREPSLRETPERAYRDRGRDPDDR